MMMYYNDQELQRRMLAHPIGIDSSGLFFSFLCREMAKNYLHNLKCGSIPRYLLHIMMKVVMC